MRILTNHLAAGEQSPLIIEVVDEPGPGGANHRYDITGFDTETNPSATSADGYRSSFSRLPIIFQNGVVKDGQMTGVTMEALLAICENRLEGFQSGNFACAENATALEGVQRALTALQARTERRIAKQIEGTEQAA